MRGFGRATGRRLACFVKRRQPMNSRVKAIVSTFASMRYSAEARFVLSHRAIRAWPALLFLSYATACGADTACRHALVNEQKALAYRGDVADSGAPIIVRRDVNLDGREDLLVGHTCGNHGCDYSIFLGRADGKYCRVEGELGMSVRPEVGMVDVRLEGSKGRTIAIVTWTAAGATSGSYERYRLANGKITKLCDLWYGMGENPSEQTAEAAERIAVDGTEPCRGP